MRHGDNSTHALTPLYFRIGQVCEMVGVDPSVLRHWEGEFPTLRPRRSSKGQRVYDRATVDRIIEVKHLLYDKRFTIEGARKQLRARGLEQRPVDDPVLMSNERMKNELTQVVRDLEQILARLDEEYPP